MVLLPLVLPAPLLLLSCEERGPLAPPESVGKRLDIAVRTHLCKL